jgi:hypothetical protein
MLRINPATSCLVTFLCQRCIALMMLSRSGTPCQYRSSLVNSVPNSVMPYSMHLQVENVNLSRLVNRHSDYLTAMDEILEVINMHDV